jgi:epoxide hydrolase-like predicted phosphatase
VPSATPNTGSNTGTGIEAVLWDYGGVFTASPFAAARAYAATTGTDPEVLIDLVFGPSGTDTDHPWHRLERGEVAMGDALTAITDATEAAGVPFDLREMWGHVANDPVDRSVVIETVRQLRIDGVRTAVVTNNIREYGDVWRANLDADELFDVIVDSCHEGVRKPDPKIYRTALERVGVDDPARAVFLDDHEGNVTAARDLGLHGIVVGADPRVALAELDALRNGG